MTWFRQLKHLDWILVGATIPVLAAGLVSMYAFVGENNYFEKQLFLIPLAFFVFLGLSFVDVRALRKTHAILALFLVFCFSLMLLFLLGSVFKGARGWFDLGFFAIQPADPMKLVLILILAKYFSRRHIEIAHLKHIIVSGLYTLIPLILVLIQPDFGSAIILFMIWFGMTIVSGISKKHLLLVFGIGAFVFQIGRASCRERVCYAV